MMLSTALLSTIVFAYFDSTPYSLFQMLRHREFKKKYVCAEAKETSTRAMSAFKAISSVWLFDNALIQYKHSIWFVHWEFV